MSDEPLISCLMVTLPTADRFEGMKRSVADYLRQTYAPRELVIALDGRVQNSNAQAIKTFVAALDRRDIRIIEPSGGLTLGALRNISMGNARGEVACQWDDDDLHHPERLQRQFSALTQSGGEGLCLQQVMHFFPAERRLYCINFHNAEQAAVPGTLICWKSARIAWPETGDQARLGEDTAVVLQLQARGRYGVLADTPHLYVYVAHGENSFGENHHRSLVVRHGLSSGLLRRRERALRQGLAPFTFGKDAVTVQGTNGPAFIIA